MQPSVGCKDILNIDVHVFCVFQSAAHLCSQHKMDIRKFFGVVPSGKRQECETVKKSEKIKNGEGPSNGKKREKETKVNNSPSEDDSKQKRMKKKRRIIYDSDSEEEVQSVKKSKKSPEKKAATSKLGKVLKQDPVVYISETDEDDDFSNKRISLKPKENGMSATGRPGTNTVKKEEVKPQAKSKPLSPVKQTPTSALDFFGTRCVQRSEKKLVASKRKEPSQSSDSTLDDEAIARQLQLEEDSELERQLHEDEEFARTLAMLDETPQKKKARKDTEGEQTVLSINSSPNTTAAGYKESERVKATESAGAAKNYSVKPQAKPEQLKGSRLSPQSSDGKKEVMAEKERGAQNSLSREKAASGKEEKTTPKKEKVSPKKTESVSPEDSEKKRNNYQAYRSFLNREGPKALGSKEIPQGAENCLEGLTFVITGVLECIERDEAKSLIERYGGKVTGNVSKKTNYLVVGRDCGQSKCEKASTLGTKVIDEDGLFDLIRTMPGKKSKYELAAEAEAKKGESKPKKTPQKAEAGKRNFSPFKREADNKKYKSTPEKGDTIRSAKKETTAVRKLTDFRHQTVEEKGAPKPTGNLVSEVNEDGTEKLLWVDKYKPVSLKAIIGQQGDQSCANKLLRWLRNWHKNTFEDGQAKPGKTGSKDDGTGFKAALLSGPPGVGKTTTAALVCKELGYSYVELNASDTRSKNSLKEVVAESLNNTSIKDFCSGASSSVSGKHVLIMDEVDGMAGNEDRGGIQELIGLIRHTKIPIICMCNDRNHPKMRSLVHYCLDLRFQRPRLEQIKGAMMSIAFKEGLKIPPPAMQEIILAANQDIRQVLHNLNMWCAKDKSLTYDEAKTDANRAKKDIKLGPFDVVRKVFAAGEEVARMSLIDKSDLFFHDYSLAPLFVQENYVHVKPAAAGGNLKKHLVLLSRAADSICDGDIVDRQIRSKQNWNLLPTQAIYASVLPGELMRGYMSQFPVFPSWLGKFSSTGKHDRIIQELAMHMSLRTQTCKRTVNMEYLSYLRDALVQPLKDFGADGVQQAITFMDSYCLMKEDVENIMEISTWGGKPSPFSKLDPKVKAAFTRAYNKEAHLTPYSLSSVKASKRQSVSAATLDLSEDLNVEEIQSDEDEQDTVDSDAMIKQKKVKSSKLPKREKNEETTKKEGKRKQKTRHLE
ncbi:replication factor C subunit 1 isoform X2 [Poecile atricapillus]|uniref:replication factor C subunit 1 isoform X2 n=1 Tax=Poecile atricapillus TaxID=48891 RepID=UPI002739B06A|nr:replication factor C subunit 1 isoform X2 [Poecile atricapillus]XP_058693108.1 replication factor C subunit 1 isoform X2 [Poecile atricapillus]